VLLPLATLTFLAASCAPQVAAETIAAIAQTESGRDPLAIHDNSTRESHHPSEKGEAAALA
jgi:type IV secretion system protein VirB1